MAELMLLINSVDWLFNEVKNLGCNYPISLFNKEFVLQVLQKKLFISLLFLMVEDYSLVSACFLLLKGFEQVDKWLLSINF